MYHAHFGLSEEPFGASPDGRFFLATEHHREAEATLFYAIQQRRGFTLLVADPGLGKTSLLMRLLQLLDGRAKTAYLSHQHLDSTTLMESVLLALGIQPTASAPKDRRVFLDFLLETRRADKTCVVVFDEAQGLNRDTLEAIRKLSNFETPSEKLVQIVLAGQSAIADTLKQPDCEQLRQRVNVVARLKPLCVAEVYAYMAHRLKTAGGSIDLFTNCALETIAHESAGIPRNVNTICFNSLSLAYALDHRQVGHEEVVEVMRDLDLTLDEVPPLSSQSRSATACMEARRSSRPDWMTMNPATVILKARAQRFRKNHPVVSPNAVSV